MTTCAPYHAILEMSRADSEEAPPDPVLQAAQAGDPDAFEAIYRAHMGRVYALCLGMTADPVVAAELLQDTFIQVWRENPQLLDHADPKLVEMMRPLWERDRATRAASLASA